MVGSGVLNPLNYPMRVLTSWESRKSGEDHKQNSANDLSPVDFLPLGPYPRHLVPQPNAQKKSELQRIPVPRLGPKAGMELEERGVLRPGHPSEMPRGGCSRGTSRRRPESGRSRELWGRSGARRGNKL